MTFAVFFSVDALGRTVAPEQAETCTGTDALLELLACLSSDDDFFGVFDEQGVCLRVRYLSAANRYWLEVTRPDLQGAFGQHLTFDDAAELLAELPDSIPEEGLPGSEFRQW